MAPLQMVVRVKEFQPQNISNTVWAFASLGHQPSEKFLEIVEEHLMEHMEADTLKYSCQVRSYILLQALLGRKHRHIAMAEAEASSTYQHLQLLVLTSEGKGL